MSTSKTEYIPGVCNINHAEIAKRRMIGHIGFAVFVILLLVFISTSTSLYLRVLLFIPAFMTFSGYGQARQKFCTGYAAAGKQNASKDSKIASVITDKDALMADKRKGRQMNLRAFVLAIITVAIALIIPRR